MGVIFARRRDAFVYFVHFVVIVLAVARGGQKNAPPKQQNGGASRIFLFGFCDVFGLETLGAAGHVKCNRISFG
jgi:hypothetical protein